MKGHQPQSFLFDFKVSTELQVPRTPAATSTTGPTTETEREDQEVSPRTRTEEDTPNLRTWRRTQTLSRRRDQLQHEQQPRSLKLSSQQELNKRLVLQRLVLKVQLYLKLCQDIPGLPQDESCSFEFFSLHLRIFQHIQGYLKFLTYPRLSPDLSRTSQDIPGCPRMPQDVPGCPRMSQDVPEYHRICCISQDFLGRSRIICIDNFRCGDVPSHSLGLCTRGSASHGSISLSC